MLRKIAGKLIFVPIIAVLVIFVALPGLCGCSQCGSIQGIDVNERDGTVVALPVVAGVDTGLGAPQGCDAANLPGSGNVRNFGTANSPNIKWGTSRITTNETDVLMNGTKITGWSWNSGSKTLMTPQGYLYVFNNSLGMLTGSSGPDGLFVTAYAYDATYLDRIASVTDSLGNTWTYGVDPQKPGPDYVVNPDGIRKVGYTYKAIETNGAGQYDTITVYKVSGGNWTEQEHTTYTYDSDNKLTEVSTTDFDDAENPSTTVIEYVSGTEGGRTNPVRRIYNSKLHVDTYYEYGTESIAETYGGSNTYGYTQARRRATYGSSDNSSDQVTRTYYYQNGNSENDFIYKIVQMVSDGSGGLQAYSTVKYQVFGYLTRFAASPPAYSDTLSGKSWKIVDARGNTTTYTYSPVNGLATRIDLPTGDNIQYWYKKIGGIDSAYIEKVRDSRGMYTRYFRELNDYPSLVTKVEVSDSADGNGAW